MTENQIKGLCKFAIENGKRKLTKEEKEILKTAVDEACDLNQLLQIALVSLPIDRKR